MLELVSVTDKGKSVCFRAADENSGAREIKIINREFWSSLVENDRTPEDLSAWLGLGMDGKYVDERIPAALRRENRKKPRNG